MMWKNGSGSERDSNAAVIGANELKPLSLTLCKRYDLLFLCSFPAGIVEHWYHPIHTYCVYCTVYSHSLYTMQHSWQWWVTFMVWKFALDFFFTLSIYSSFPSFVRSFCLCLIKILWFLFGISWYIFHYSIIVCSCVCEYVCKSIKTRAEKL